jgi:hypothetical protein
MGALSPTIVKATEFSGDYKVLILTVTPAAASDTVTLTKATHGISSIVYASGHLTAGLDANLTILQVSFSGLVITIKQLKADGATNADNWDSAKIELLVIGSGS